MTQYASPCVNRLNKPTPRAMQQNFPKIVRPDWSYAKLLIVNHSSITATIAEQIFFTLVRTKIQWVEKHPRATLPSRKGVADGAADLLE